VQLLVGDCGLQADMRRVMLEFSSREQRLDGLVCNAGANPGASATS
jgi:NADP-dependent 3-hydroxy acid dehydrogenase YdfG